MEFPDIYMDILCEIVVAVTVFRGLISIHVKAMARTTIDPPTSGAAELRRSEDINKLTRVPSRSTIHQDSNNMYTF